MAFIMGFDVKNRVGVGIYRLCEAVVFPCDSVLFSLDSVLLSFTTVRFLVTSILLCLQAVCFPFLSFAFSDTAILFLLASVVFLFYSIAFFCGSIVFLCVTVDWPSNRVFFMRTTIKPLSSPEHIPHPPLDPLLAAIGAPLRWAILTELASGEPRMVKEIAQKLGRSPTLVSKHMAVLRRAGVVEIGRAGVYQIPAHFVAAADKRHIDLGHCLLRLPGTEA